MVVKEIKITLYTPKELWAKFCNWVFWPRRKECAEWCEVYEDRLSRMIADIFEEAERNGVIDDDVAAELEVSIKKANEKVSKEVAGLMSMPF